MQDNNKKDITYFKILATSIISGISSEKPALDLFLLIDQI